MLVNGQWKAAKFWYHKALQNFDCGTEKEDGVIAGAKVGGIACFEERDDDCRLPDGWYVCVSAGEFEEASEVVDARGAKVFEVVCVKTIRSSGAGVGIAPNGLGNKGRLIKAPLGKLGT